MNCSPDLICSGFGVLQRGKELALQRQNLKLFRSPFRTSYYFFGSASAATGRGFLWLAGKSKWMVAQRTKTARHVPTGT